ncbi:sulfurtransferase complex subunit TusB [Tropicimonas sp. IMCC6043]|uniref:sulfurtransferase complex subunit TusB n=1 Tax=Tropicimonas sp. IMCC6043 TaxID=2510645 RepID=UPI00101B697C|nr:sulfurtransferase complex subunit TusB [Tropicimonas sp. IMCC6043]RYH12230.1 sulfurtransferase complex subunit TusB [Tropicimonas sp. IMCC6043]
MSTLHTVNKSPFGNGALLSCINHCKPGDAVLLIEDGVYGALAGSVVEHAVITCAPSVSIYVLEGDAEARGIGPAKRLPDVQSVGYDGFVDLVATHDRTQAWL